jgi:catechol 2,3-dioxygenase-like lactoylglutathione lyase family enzyme
MDKAVEFFRDRLGLELKFQSTDWSEFATGETTLALHIASESQPAGNCQVGFGSDDLDGFCNDASALGVEFTSAPTESYGHRIAKFRDSEGTECSVSGQ